LRQASAGRHLHLLRAFPGWIRSWIRVSSQAKPFFQFRSTQDQEGAAEPAGMLLVCSRALSLVCSVGRPCTCPCVWHRFSLHLLSLLSYLSVILLFCPISNWPTAIHPEPRQPRGIQAYLPSGQHLQCPCSPPRRLPSRSSRQPSSTPCTSSRIPASSPFAQMCWRPRAAPRPRHHASLPANTAPVATTVPQRKAERPQKQWQMSKPAARRQGSGAKGWENFTSTALLSARSQEECIHRVHGRLWASAPIEAPR
jgi:hypothetical protein